ncbi:MAG: hypothetical protein ACI4C3_03495 [Bacteroides sp.]
MKWLISNILLLVALSMGQAKAQSINDTPGVHTPDTVNTLTPCGDNVLTPDTVYVVHHDTVWLQQPKADSVYTAEVNSRYDRRIHRYRKHWYSLIPTYSKLQYAGNMGLLSLGFGWDYGKHNQWETDLLFGYLPKYDSDRSKITMTLKQNYIPWNITLGQGPFSFEPLSCGLYFNTVFGDEFWVSEPDRYPKGYYGFSSKIRTHIFLGQRITFEIPRKKRFMAKSITFFYELSSCDLYIVSAFTNGYLRPHDYLSLSFGLKLQTL